MYNHVFKVPNVYVQIKNNKQLATEKIFTQYVQGPVACRYISAYLAIVYDREE